MTNDKKTLGELLCSDNKTIQRHAKGILHELQRLSVESIANKDICRFCGKIHKNDTAICNLTA